MSHSLIYLSTLVEIVSNNCLFFLSLHLVSIRPDLCYLYHCTGHLIVIVVVCERVPLLKRITLLLLLSVFTYLLHTLLYKNGR